MHLIFSQLRVRVAAVGRARLLRDDALAALLADRVEHLLAAADDMVAVEDRRRNAFEQCREPLLALDVGQLADVLAAIDQQVEGVEGEVGAPPSLSVDCSSWKLGLPSSSSATASPSIRQPAGSLAAALTSALNLSLQSMPLRVQAVATPSPTASSSR